MNYKFLVVLLYMFGYAMNTKYKNLEFFTTFFFLTFGDAKLLDFFYFYVLIVPSNDMIKT